MIDPTLLTTGPALVGLTIYITYVLVKAICGGDDALRDRYGPAIALMTAILLVTCYVLAPNFETYTTLLIGVLNAAISSGAYKVGKLAIANTVKGNPSA